MRHYEIVFLVHPDQSEQVPHMVERYRATIENRAAPSTAWKTGGGVSWPTPSIRFTRRTTF